jgi:hypothetical protein
MEIEHLYTRNDIIETTNEYMWMRYFIYLSRYILAIMGISVLALLFGYLMVFLITTIAVIVIIVVAVKSRDNWLRARLRYLEILNGVPVKFSIIEDYLQISTSTGVQRMKFGLFEKVIIGKNWVYLVYLDHGFLSVPKVFYLDALSARISNRKA